MERGIEEQRERREREGEGGDREAGWEEGMIEIMGLQRGRERKGDTEQKHKEKQKEKNESNIA